MQQTFNYKIPYTVPGKCLISNSKRSGLSLEVSCNPMQLGSIKRVVREGGPDDESLILKC